MPGRFVPVLNAKYLPCRGISFFKLLEEYFGQPTPPIHRVFSLMRKRDAESLVIEQLTRQGQLDEELTEIETYSKSPIENLKAWRFSFFDRPVTLDLLSYVPNGAFLGYAIYICFKLADGNSRQYVYESVLSPPALRTTAGQLLDVTLPNHYLHGLREYSGWVQGHRFCLKGSFFSQQNALTHVCAHASIRWLVNNLPDRAERIYSNVDINRVLRQLSKVAYDPSKGLTIGDIQNVITDPNFSPERDSPYAYLQADYTKPREITGPYWQFVYSIIESGYPVLIIFTTQGSRHVICAVGHTLNSDMWDEEAKLAYGGAPQSRYLPSCSWTDHFVIHDDNFGMYLCTPIKALQNPQQKVHDGSDEIQVPLQVVAALGIVPTEMKLDPVTAEIYASRILRNVLRVPYPTKSYWLDKLMSVDIGGPSGLVLRTLFVNKTRYKQHLCDVEDRAGNFLKREDINFIISSITDEYFYLTEVSLTDLYTANKHKLGEILYSTSVEKIPKDDPDFDRKVFKGFKGFRLPGYMLVTGPQTKKSKGMTGVLRTVELTGHVPLLRTCPKLSHCEW